MIELKDIYKTYSAGDVPVRALNGVSLKIERGEFVAIMGASGSGKSTLMHILGFLDRPDSGSYQLFGRPVSDRTDDELAALRNHLAGFVFQQFHLLRRSSALENTEMPLVYAGKRHLKAKALEVLGAVGLSLRASHRPNQLSGGEQQRVAIARSLVNDPLIIFADEPTGNLDTKTEEEILSILKRLNSEGRTIVMVTHEKEIAQHAGRIITMRDGRIVADERKSAAAAAAPADKKDIAEEITRNKAVGIEIVDHLKQAFGAMLAHGMRSFLSVLGVLIGVAAVISMLAIGSGAKEAIEARLRSLGSNLLYVRPGSAKVRGIAMETGDTARFTAGDVEAIREVPYVKDATGLIRGRGQLVYAENNWNTRLEGVGYEYGQMLASIPATGRWFTEEEIRRRDKIAIIGLTVAEELFGNEDPVGKIIKINRLNFEVIGILPEKGASAFRDMDDLVLIPMTTAMYRVLGKDYLDGIYAEIESPEAIPEAEEEITKVIVKRHRFSDSGDDMFNIRNMSDIQETLESTTRTMSVLLGCIAAISLLVGGIGIMNIMLVSVTERTREIGLRKAIGARAKDIMSQFLIESVAMSLSGGILGVITGSLIALMLSAFAGWATRVTLSSVIMAVGFSVTVGVVFGLWPAREAAKLNPIEALRYE